MSPSVDQVCIGLLMEAIEEDYTQTKSFDFTMSLMVSDIVFWWDLQISHAKILSRLKKIQARYLHVFVKIFRISAPISAKMDLCHEATLETDNLPTSRQISLDIVTHSSLYHLYSKLIPSSPIPTPQAMIQIHSNLVP